MTIEDLYFYLGRKFETTCDSMLYQKGTFLEIKGIDIRKFEGRIKTRFRCAVNGGKPSDDAYLDADEFSGWVGYALKEIA